MSRAADRKAKHARHAPVVRAGEARPAADRRPPRRCLHCKTRPRHRASVWCAVCTAAGRTRAAALRRHPWWTWVPYRGVDIDAYVARVIAELERDPDPALVCRARRMKVDLP